MINQINESEMFMIVIIFTIIHPSDLIERVNLFQI